MQSGDMITTKIKPILEELLNHFNLSLLTIKELSLRIRQSMQFAMAQNL